MALAVVATVLSGAFATPVMAGGYDNGGEKAHDGASSSGDSVRQSNQCSNGGSASGSGGLIGAGVNANLLSNQQQTCSNTA